MKSLKDVFKTAEYSSTPIDLFSRIAPTLLWFIFFLTAVTAFLGYTEEALWKWGGLLRIDSFTLLIWCLVSFLSALLATYSRRYLSGFRYQNRFMAYILVFTISVMLLPASEHLLVLLGSWLAMGLTMSELIGIDSHRGETREAANICRRYFMLGTLMLGTGILVMAYWSQTFVLSTLLESLESLPKPLGYLSAICLIGAAIIQSAIFPFHRWLLSSMTAPTPASALMHAGFVNGAGILLTMFAPLLVTSGTLSLLLIIGGLSAILAQFGKLLQVNVKQKLACSTIAQMGFMLMQCGLGFFNAAVAHLILHGFYKAYLFLSSGEGIEQTRPQDPPRIRIRPLQALSVLINGAIGTLLFVWLTGKGSSLNSGIFLTLIVAITVGQVTYNFVKQQNLSVQRRIWVPLLLNMGGIVLYALVFNGVTALMGGRPMIAVASPLSVAQLGFGFVFLTGFFIMKLGVYQRFPWLYVKLLNLTQPFKNTVLKYHNKTI